VYVTHVVLDGPMGTELGRRGVPTPTPTWSAHAIGTAPETIAAIHRDYVGAGATVHTANTFRTKRRTVGARWEELARQAVRIARASVPPGHRVAGSIAPLEDCYRTDLSPGVDSRQEHRELARVLADEGVDLLLCETFSSAIEARVAVEEAVRTGVETWVALTAGPDASLMTPNEMREAARACRDIGARALLVSCTPATRTLAFVERVAEVGAPFGAYSNAGHPDEGIGWDANPSAGARAYAKLAMSWANAGATILGGCCGTGPEHVAELARALQWTGLTSTRP
jgi:S-methylmethionine-dependent homocysteine/selenocysteine methylase